MTGLLEAVVRAVDDDCLVKGKLNKDGCSVVMTGVPSPRLVVDFDKPGSPLVNKTRCDYLLVAEGGQEPGWVAVLELKRGRLHADQVVRQLQAGASASAKLVPPGKAVRFRPIAASGRTPKHERTELKKKSNTIRFRGHDEPVRLMSCSSRLAALLD